MQVPFTRIPLKSFNTWLISTFYIGLCAGSQAPLHEPNDDTTAAETDSSPAKQKEPTGAISSIIASANISAGLTAPTRSNTIDNRHH